VNFSTLENEGKFWFSNVLWRPKVRE